MKKKQHNNSEEVDYSMYDKNIEDVTIDEYVYNGMIKYGINIALFRACPAFIDALTPVERRTIYAMYKQGYTYDKPRGKASDLLGKVAAYHPHGSQSIENSFRNNIKEYESNVILYDTHGATGSISGTRAAAVRYLDTRLSKFCCKAYFDNDDFSEDLLEMVDTYTKQKKEPVVLQPKYPIHYLRNVTGIAWGYAFSAVPFNLEEVFRLTQELIKNPNMKDVWLYPDSPRGYDIIETDDIVDICENGKGTLKIQARIEYHEGLDHNKKPIRYLEVCGFPEQTTMQSIMEKISNLVVSKQLSDIEDLQNKTILEDVKFWVMLSKNADPERVKDELYRKTPLRGHLAINLNYAARTKMEQHLGIADGLRLWISNRIAYKSKYIAKKIVKMKERVHVIDGIMVALTPQNVDKTVEIIKTSKSVNDAVEALISHYGITSYQAKSITDIKLSNLVSQARQDFTDELHRLHDKIKESQEIVSSRDKIKQIIIDELEEGIKLFGKPRACRIISADNLVKKVYNFNVIITKKYIKKVSVGTTSVGALDSDDEVVAFFKGIPDTRQIVVIDNFGRCYGINLSKIQPCDLVSKGTLLKDQFGVTGNVISAFNFGDNMGVDIDDVYITMFTTSGIIKTSKLSQYVTNRTELQGIVLNPGDNVCYVSIHEGVDMAVGDSYVLIYTKNGFGLTFDVSTVPITDRMTKGSNFLKLDDGDVIQGVTSITPEKESVFVLSSKGYGKICDLDDIMKTARRRATMIKLTGLDEGDSVFKIIPINKKDKTKFVCVLQSGERVEITRPNIKETTRVSKGKKLVKVKLGDSIIRVREV